MIDTVTTILLDILLFINTDGDLVDADDNPIEIKSFGEGIVNAK